MAQVKVFLTDGQTDRRTDGQTDGQTGFNVPALSRKRGTINKTQYSQCLCRVSLSGKKGIQ